MPKQIRRKKRTSVRRRKQGQPKRRVRQSVKDRLFRFLFGKDREALLELYNALNGTTYSDSSQMEIVTIGSAVYIVMENDLAYILAGTLSLYEHQSTYSLNMPVRFLIYLAQEYQMVTERDERSLYGTGQISLPTPQCVVFYNGTREMPEEQTLRLSDAFENKNVRADVELTVRMLNINSGHNKQLMEKCRTLEEYSQFVAATRECMLEEEDIQTALNKAVDDCIERGILKEFLIKNRSEVLGMLFEEFDAEKYERTIRSEAREEGEGKVNRLGVLLEEAGRTADFLNSLSDRELQKRLFVEFGLEEEK